jgi:hypothetical protein
MVDSVPEKFLVYESSVVWRLAAGRVRCIFFVAGVVPRLSDRRGRWDESSSAVCVCACVCVQ